MPFISPTPTLEASEPPGMCETPRAHVSESAASCHEEDAHDKPNFDTIALALIKIATEVGKLNNVSDIRILSATILPAIQCLSRKIDDIEASMKAELSQVKAQVDALCRQAEVRPSGEARDRDGDGSVRHGRRPTSKNFNTVFRRK
ncbi:hypothetical protein NM208_g9534 [Fusarium decemcellulare]|uniref:Uncharacterized protein n=1 Tax=Fusarium decemcellulare TaxID=57161 RepID=A0ACC1S172_9HYPO|nr:hypothetical protein NM208_g9534 [Fusarium decemcellulare]